MSRRLASGRRALLSKSATGCVQGRGALLRWAIAADQSRDRGPARDKGGGSVGRGVAVPAARAARRDAVRCCAVVGRSDNVLMELLGAVRRR